MKLEHHIFPAWRKPPSHFKAIKGFRPVAYFELDSKGEVYLLAYRKEEQKQGETRGDCHTILNLNVTSLDTSFEIGQLILPFYTDSQAREAADAAWSLGIIQARSNQERGRLPSRTFKRQGLNRFEIHIEGINTFFMPTRNAMFAQETARRVLAEKNAQDQKKREEQST